MRPLYDAHATRKAVNLGINSDLLQKARAADINLSATLEKALAETLLLRQQQQWLADNRDAMADYNRLVEQEGVFSDGLRSF